MRIRIPENAQTVLLTLMMAGIAALTAVVFLVATHQVFAWTYETFAKQSDLSFVIATFLTIVSSSLAVGFLLSWAGPLAVGSGIPQLKAAYWKETGVIPLKPVLVKFVAGILSIGGGASLGREGPTLFFGGGLASNIAGWFKVPRHLRRAPAAVGASAGLAAAFNTPLAAITFVLEEILGDLSSRALGRMILASVTGAFVVYAFLGPQPAFLMPPVDRVSWWLYLILPAVALATAFLGVAFQRSVLALRKRVKSFKKLPNWILPLVGGVTTWLIGVAVYLTTHKIGVFGLGYQDLEDVLNNHFVWWIAGYLVVAKLVATVVSYAFNGCGGIFSPLLFLGGLTGFFLAGLATQIGIPLTGSDAMALAAMGMATCLGTVLRAPLSCLLIVFEMTHEFAMVPGLLLGLLVSTLVSRLAGDHNFYDALLVQDGHRIHQIHPPMDFQAWKSLPVASLATASPVVLDAKGSASWSEVVAAHPYRVFPVVEGGRPIGTVFRTSVELAQRLALPASWMPAVVCPIGACLGDVETRFLESSAGVVLLADDDGRLVGLLTLHDLIRAQAALKD